MLQMMEPGEKSEGQKKKKRQNEFEFQPMLLYKGKALHVLLAMCK